MNNKKIISYLLIVVMLLSSVLTCAATTPAIELSDKTVYVDKGASANPTVDVEVSLKNNPGVISMMLDIGYDSSVMTLKSVADKGVFGANTFHSDDYTLNPYRLSFGNDTASANITTNGDIAVLTFEVNKDAAAGAYPVTVTYAEDDIYDVDFDNISFSTKAATITVKEKEYTVTFKNYDGSVLDTKTTTYGGSVTYGGSTPVKPADNQYSYTFSGWDKALTNITADIVATAQFDSAVREYKVTFKNYDGTVLDTKTTTHGGSVTYGGATPTRPATAQYTYTFSGWDKGLTNITADTVITAKFDSTIREYTVTFKVDSATYGTQSVAYGSKATKPADPSKNGYIFDGWYTSANEKFDFATTITGTLTLTAKFTSIPAVETPKANVASGAVESGTKVTLSTTTTGATIYYTINGDTPTTSSAVYTGAITITEATTIKAVAVKTGYLDSSVATFEYTIKVIDANAPTIYGGKVTGKPGETVDVTVSIKNNPGIIVTIFTVGYDSNVMSLKKVSFDGLLPNNGSASKYTKNPYAVSIGDDAAEENMEEDGDLVTLIFEIKENVADGEYPITLAMKSRSTLNIDIQEVKFETVNGAVNVKSKEPAATPVASITSGEIDKGTKVTLSTTTPDATIYYTTDGNEPTTSSSVYNGEITINSDTTLKAIAVHENYYDSSVATYTWTIKMYTVTFKNYDGSVLDTQTAAYGDGVTYNGEEPTRPENAQYTYIFRGWDKALTNITADTVITAKYDSIEKEYTVTFKNYDGSVLDTQVTTYGGSVTYGGATPTKPADAQYTYTFSGWDEALTNITANTVITAQFNSVEKETVASPEASVASGTVASGTKVALSTTTTGATIYYTTNGNAPTTSSAVYEEEITITATTTIKAFAVKEGCIDSSVSVFEYTVESSDANVPTIYGASVTGKAGETVDVTVSIKNNPGIIVTIFTVGYDSDVMTLTGVTFDGLLPNNGSASKYTKNPYTVSIGDDTAEENMEEDGDLVTLTFEISEDAVAGEYPITLAMKSRSTLDVDIQEVKFETVNGIITIAEDDVIIGDVNGDGEITQTDRIILSRYIAEWDNITIDEVASDVNCDGEITQTDRIILARYIAEWEGYETLPYVK